MQLISAESYGAKRCSRAAVYTWLGEGDKIPTGASVTLREIADAYGITPSALYQRAWAMVKKKKPMPPFDDVLPDCVYPIKVPTGISKLPPRERLMCNVPGVEEPVSMAKCFRFAVKKRHLIWPEAPVGTHLGDYSTFMRLCCSICKGLNMQTMSKLTDNERGEIVLRAYRMIDRMAREDKAKWEKKNRNGH